MADEEVTVWLNAHRMEALEEQLALQGSSVEEHLQDYLIDLYAEMVPHEEQQRINNTLAEEAKADAEVREANRRFRVFRIMEGGSEALMAAEGNVDMLKTAQDLRAYVKSPPNRLGFYSTIIGHHFITEEEYSDAVAERMDNTGRVVGAYEIDLDSGEFSALHIMDGWKTFHVKDICSAAYRAMRKEYASWDDRWERFLSALDGKELTDLDMVQEVEELADPQFGSM